MQQHKTNMINDEWNKTQNDAPFVAFYDMHAVMFVLPDETLFILRKKHWIWKKNYPPCCNPMNNGESSRLYLILVASYDIP